MWARACRNLSLLALFTACGGGDNNDDVDTPVRPTFSCDDSRRPADAPWRRLSNTQHRLTLQDLLTNTLPDHADAVLAELDAPLTQLVPDVPQGPDKHFGALSSLDQAVTQAHIERAYDLATATAIAITTPARLPALSGSCDPSSTACLQAFVADFGALALRRGLDEADVAFYLQPAGEAPHDSADWADVITLLLLAPDHLYHVERTPEDGQLLDAHALANRLAFHAWQRPPDATLRALATSGELLDDTVYGEQVERVFADARARSALESFFGEWLGNPILEPLDSRLGTPVYDAFRGDFTPTAGLRQQMLNDVTDSVIYHTIEEKGTWDDVLASDYSFARSPELASLYGTPVWDGQNTPPTITQPERAGLITRAAYVATGSANSRPIMKGVFLRKALLCDTIGVPPAGASDKPPELQPDMSTRQFVEVLTGTGECKGCHERQINPLGFATENFDALGRPRSEQVLLEPTTGEVLGAVPVDTSGVPWVDGDEAIDDAHDLTALLIASDKPHACLTRHWFRFTHARIEDIDDDGCALAAMDAALDDGLPLHQALQRLALDPSFRRVTPATE